MVDPELLLHAMQFVFPQFCTCVSATGGFFSKATEISMGTGTGVVEALLSLKFS
jgi:hypothetical protein